ncbi:peroxisomal biogenesis factor 19 [Holotrichia oblita]|uniref:Peroxisomal biogenesis factor 19 n=1 Tax=Holotrichia oblita TaxID=644536 RepID=A0ACB9SMP2_HOLOL|nr:peroxisomal biogenesis factor 19 [Holotrichia oblita]
MSEEKGSSQEPKKEIDKELSELLDSALSDFSKEPEKAAAEAKKDEEEPKGEAEEAGADADWSDEFLRQAAERFESNLGRLLGDNSDAANLSPEQIQESFQKMAEAAQQVLTNPEVTDTSTDFSSAISQTLRGLSEGAENLQNPLSEQEFFNMFGDGPEQNGFVPFMQGMMQSLLSKDVLYPSLKDILEKFPEWLRENESKLTPEEKERYLNQQKLMDDVCKELESETEADTSEVKHKRFEKVLSLMQRLQDYGQPPADLVGDVGPGIQFDPQGNPEQCSMM